MKAAVVCVSALLTAIAWAQFPGQPRNQGSGIPFPKMPKKDSKSKAEQAKRSTRPPVLHKGRVDEVVEEHILVRASDARQFTYHTDEATKYLRNGDPLQRAMLKPGDEVEITAHADSDGYYYAEAISLIKPTGIPDVSAKAAPEKEPEPAAPIREASTVRKLEPIGGDDDETPRLRRGIQQHSQRAVRPATVEPVPTGVREAPVPAPKPPAAPVSIPAASPIEKARHVAMTFTESLPNYFCQQITTRYAGRGRPISWNVLDLITAELVYEDGKEQYRKLTLNNKPINKSIEELGGSWSKGEFASVLFDVFSPSTAARFRLRQSDTIARRIAWIYDFDVDQPRSHWRVQVGGQTYHPAYRGSMWIDKETFRVLRIEMRAVKLPADFPLDSVETATDYEFVRLGDANLYLLPVHAENLSCIRGTQDCYRNAIDFRNYRKYSGESTIIFTETGKP
jgi:hypothetical protein